jgi:hypothetical protein
MAINRSRRAVAARRRKRRMGHDERTFLLRQLEIRAALGELTPEH